MAGGRHKYSEAQKAHALSALMMSADQDPKTKEWRPQFRDVARAEGITDMTLRRWWKARDASQDVALRRAATQARDKAQTDGASDWLTRLYSKMQDRLDWIADPERLKPVTAADDSGREYVIQPAAQVHQLSRALTDSAKLAVELDQRLNGDGETGMRSSRLAELRRRAKAAGVE